MDLKVKQVKDFLYQVDKGGQGTVPVASLQKVARAFGLHLPG